MAGIKLFNEVDPQQPTDDSLNVPKILRRSNTSTTVLINRMKEEPNDVLIPTGFVSDSEFVVPPIQNFVTPIQVRCKENHFDINSLKKLVTHPTKKTRIRPVLISFSGLPESGKTMAVDHILENYVNSSPLIPVTNTTEKPKATGISHYELVAAGLNPFKDLCITEVTLESSLAMGILSAFKNDFLANGKIPLFDLDAIELTQKFGSPMLDNHLLIIYKYLCGQTSIPKGPKLTIKEMEYIKKLKTLLPNGIALINIWDLSISETVRHFLAALHGHLYNNHTWLFLDLKRDLDHLDEPPEIKPIQGRNDAAVFMKWRPRLHYLLRSCRMSENKNKTKQKKRMCTIFAKHDGTSHNGELQEKIDKLEKKIQPVAKQAGFSTLLEEKIQTINLSEKTGNADDYSRRLYQKFQHVIYESSFEDIPLVWVFLRSVLQCYDKEFINKKDLEEIATKCGMTKESFNEFCRFYTSFGSILDLSLVNPNYKYIITKPIEFLKSLDSCLYPNDTLRRKYPTIQYGIIPNKTCRDSEVFGGDWPAYTDALLSLNLAIRVTKSSIELPPEISSNDPQEMYYYITLSRSHDQATPLIKAVDYASVHVITSIDTPHIFKQVALTKHLLKSLPQSKLIPCSIMNQTIIKDYSTGTTLTLISHSPAMRLHLDKPNVEICSRIVEAYCDIAKNYVTANYKFVILCSSSDIPDVQSIPSSHYHVLPDEQLCDDCIDAGKSDLVKVWNEALKKIPTARSKSETLGVVQLANIAEKISLFDINLIAKALDYPVEGTDSYKDDPRFKDMLVLDQDKPELINLMLIYWDKQYRSKDKQYLEPKGALARKLLEIKDKLVMSHEDKLLMSHEDKLHMSHEDKLVKSHEDKQKIKEIFDGILNELDIYYKK